MPGGDCVHGRMVPMPDGYGAILLGCNEAKDTMYKLLWNGNELEWTTMEQKLKHPRSETIIMYIPNEMTTCLTPTVPTTTTTTTTTTMNPLFGPNGPFSETSGIS